MQIWMYSKSIRIQILLNLIKTYLDTEKSKSIRILSDITFYLSPSFVRLHIIFLNWVIKRSISSIISWALNISLVFEAIQIMTSWVPYHWYCITWKSEHSLLKQYAVA